MSTRRDPGFDRLRPRGPDAPPPPTAAATGRVTDTDGKRSLFSAAEQSPPFGSVTIVCSDCGEHTVVGLRRALRLSVPSVHLPFVRPSPWSYLRCPACHRLAWVDVIIQL